jgi:hypothetical protein
VGTAAESVHSQRLREEQRERRKCAYHQFVASARIVLPQFWELFRFISNSGDYGEKVFYFQRVIYFYPEESMPVIDHRT